MHVAVVSFACPRDIVVTHQEAEKLGNQLQVRDGGE
jgi:hypothetical protein